MPSPFPGMNPYFEQPWVWEDFHSRFIAYAGELLSAQVRPNFCVKLEERVFIHEHTAEDRHQLLGKPDIALFEGVPKQSPSVVTYDPAVNQVKSIITTLPDIDTERHPFIESRDRQDRQLDTMIEVVYPAVIFRRIAAPSVSNDCPNRFQSDSRFQSDWGQSLDTVNPKAIGDNRSTLLIPKRLRTIARHWCYAAFHQLWQVCALESSVTTDFRDCALAELFPKNLRSLLHHVQ